jgi:hypothetical protein
MDVKQYYRKLREIENGFQDEFPTIVSLDTPDGGKAGLISEVSRANAARMLVEGRAVLATEDQKAQFAAHQAASRKAAEQAEIAKRVQVAILTESELQGHIQGRKK